MSYSIFVQRFAQGEPAPLDVAMMREVLRPYTMAGDGEPMLIQADDGSEADVYVDASGLMIDRPGRGKVFDVVAELVERLGAVLLLPGCPAVLRSEADREHLPEQFRQDAVVIQWSGEAIQTMIERS